MRIVRVASTQATKQMRILPSTSTSYRYMSDSTYTPATTKARIQSASIPSQYVSSDPEVEGYKTRHSVETRVLHAVMQMPKFREHTQLVAIAHELTDPKRVGPHDSLSSITLNDLQVDSLDKVELLVAVEKEFNTEFSDEEFEKFKTVGEIIEHILWTPQAN